MTNPKAEGHGMDMDEAALDALLAEVEGADLESAHLDDRWERLAEGALSEDERAALRALADEDAEAEVALAAFTPLDASFAERVADDVQRQRAAEAQESARAAEARVAPWWRRWLRVQVVGPVLAAALALVVLLPRGQGELDADTEFFISLSGEQVVRGSESASSRLSEGSAVRIRVQPEDAVSVPVEAWVYLRRAGAAVLLNGADVREPSEGAFAVDGTVGVPPWDLEPGDYAAIVVIGPEGSRAPPSLDEVPASWEQLEVSFTVEAP